MEAITFEQLPAAIGMLNDKIDRLELIIHRLASPAQKPLAKLVDINGAAALTGRTPNALRIQISQGKLQSIKRGRKNYFDTDYLERWKFGEDDKEGLKNG